MLIVDMPMPSRCGECKMHFLSSDGYVCCGITNRIPKIVGEYHNSRIDLDARQKSISAVQKPSWCPIKGELPDEHGDLIDRDALKQALCDYCDGRDTMNGEPNCTEPCFDLGLIDCMPVIIAAERKDDGTTVD